MLYDSKLRKVPNFALNNRKIYIALLQHKSIYDSYI